MPNPRRIKTVILGDLPLCRLEGMSGYAEGSGNSTWLESLFPFFGRHEGLDVHWIVMSKSASSRQSIRHSGQTIHILPRWKKSLSMLTRYTLEVRRILEVVREVDPDVVHAWGSEDVNGIAGAATGKPAIFTLQGCLNDYLEKIGGSFLFRVQAAYEVPTLRRYRHATAETPMAMEQLLSLNPDLDARIIDYGVNPCFHDTRRNVSESPTFFYAGAIDERKGVRDMLKAFESLEQPDATLRVAGDGELMEELRASSPPRVEWLGKLDKDGVRRELASCWAFVMPTYADTGPTAVKEARVVGCPVITTERAGAKCYLNHGENGFVVGVGDVAALNRSMKAIAGSKDTCLRMGAHEHEETRQQLHPTITIEKFHAFYQAVASQPTSADT